MNDAENWQDFMDHMLGDSSLKGQFYKNNLGKGAKFSWDGSEGTSTCLLYTSPSPRDRQKSRMPSSA